VLSDALVSIARGVMPNVPVHEGQGPAVRPADQLKAIEMLLDRGFGQVTPAARHSPQCL